MPTGVIHISEAIQTLQPDTIIYGKGTEHEFEIGIVAIDEWIKYNNHYLNVYRVPGGEWMFQQPYLDKGIYIVPDNRASSIRWSSDFMSDGDPLT